MSNIGGTYDLADQLPIMLGLHQTPEGLEIDFRAKNGLNDSCPGICLPAHKFLPFYSPEDHK